ncbi:hypothetical protein [Skermania piniformis]|uniref:Uncharacterized protein n=1 Tax=Skermania pinensis TaxID=39122 RepID=A0ABX8SEB3_9ACTN|nr:hypothetical protein [Skermania piniformis]QXQ15492.1 hypothetical protein KV203_09455 [Skermania piniformis]
MRPRPEPCLWCGREVAAAESGRRRRYCRQSCRQRAYEQRIAVRGTSFPADSTVLSAQEVTDLADRIFAARCAAEDVVIAIREGAANDELSTLCAELLVRARDAERLR